MHTEALLGQHLYESFLIDQHKKVGAAWAVFFGGGGQHGTFAQLPVFLCCGLDINSPSAHLKVVLGLILVCLELAQLWQLVCVSTAHTVFARAHCCCLCACTQGTLLDASHSDTKMVSGVAERLIAVLSQGHGGGEHSS